MSDDATILLVEDNSEDVALTLRALSSHGLADRVRVARDGVEALECMRSMNPKLVLLDLKLPRVDGLEVLGKIKGGETTHSIPVVVLTSSREQPDIEHAYRLGANSYIVKPVDYTQFSSAIAYAGAYWIDINLTPDG